MKRQPHTYIKFNSIKPNTIWSVWETPTHNSHTKLCKTIIMREHQLNHPKLYNLDNPC